MENNNGKERSIKGRRCVMIFYIPKQTSYQLYFGYIHTYIIALARDKIKTSFLLFVAGSRIYISYSPYAPLRPSPTWMG